MVVSTFIEILNKKQKNIIGCVYKHSAKHEVSDFTNNYITPLLDKLSNENDYGLLVTFLTQYSPQYLPYITIPTRITRNTKTLIDNIYYNKPLNDINSGNLSSIICDHLIQFLIEPLDFSGKSSIFF